MISQENIDNYKKSLDLIKQSHYILIVTHINPDADTISCSLSLSNFMYENKIKHKVFNLSKELPRVLDFLPKFDKITNQIPKYYDLIIYVDCADQKRVGIDVEYNAKIINIDHHQTNTNFANINIVDDSKASSAELLYYFFEVNNINISKNIAQCLYTGIYDDSIAFTTPRTNRDTFRIVEKLLQTDISLTKLSNNLTRRDSLAKYRILPKILNTLELHFEGKFATVYLEPQWLEETGATVSESDDVVDMVLKIAIVEAVGYIRNKNGKSRVSLRSKDSLDVSIIAKEFNGGGHKNAAGLSIDNLDIQKAKNNLLESVKKYF